MGCSFEANPSSLSCYWLTYKPRDESGGAKPTFNYRLADRKVDGTAVDSVITAIATSRSPLRDTKPAIWRRGAECSPDASAIIPRASDCGPRPAVDDLQTLN